MRTSSRELRCCCLLLLHLWSKTLLCCAFTTTYDSLKEIKRTPPSSLLFQNAFGKTNHRQYSSSSPASMKKRKTTSLAVLPPVDPSLLPPVMDLSDLSRLPFGGMDPSIIPESMMPFRPENAMKDIDPPMYNPFFDDPGSYAGAWFQGFSIGLFYVVTRDINRARLEERAFDLRIKENREQRLAADPTLTEKELIREELANSFSYDEKEREKKSKGLKTLVMEREEDDIDGGGRLYMLSEKEIRELETLGVQYDPYYDDPYAKDELPEDIPYQDVKRTGDRMYENGETFFLDPETELYFRQGSRPRMKPFWEDWLSKPIFSKFGKR